MQIQNTKINVLNGFYKSLHSYPENTAVIVNNKEYTYSSLGSIAEKIRRLVTTSNVDFNNTIGLLTSRSVASYAAIIGVLAAGKAVMPINKEFPVERSLKMIEQANARCIIVSVECYAVLGILLRYIKKKITLILIDFPEEKLVEITFYKHEIMFLESSEEKNQLEIALVEKSKTAYLLFTSGSTGEPKGVAVSHENFDSYLEQASLYYEFNSSDRFSQMFELTFDLSMHDMFVCWNSGGCLCVPNDSDLLFPVTYIKKTKLSVWFSVPTLAMLIDKYGRLLESSFPDLKYSLFCGEALPESLVKKWSLAAPNSIIENLYGPTETTIAVSRYKVPSNLDAVKSINGLISIGTIFDKQQFKIIDENQRPLGKKMIGELCIAGNQVTKGYLNNSKETNEKYIYINNDKNKRWYRTGDLVEEGDDGNLYYYGRIDNQVKINGHRVELDEISQVIRAYIHCELITTVILKEENDNNIISLIAGHNIIYEKNKIIEYCKSRLPSYMVPNDIIFVESMPTNLSGKVDVNKIKTQLKTTYDTKNYQ